jgi:hypothetical protein
MENYNEIGSNPQQYALRREMGHQEPYWSPVSVRSGRLIQPYGVEPGTLVTLFQRFTTGTTIVVSLKAPSVENTLLTTDYLNRSKAGRRCDLPIWRIV